MQVAAKLCVTMTASSTFFAVVRHNWEHMGKVADGQAVRIANCPSVEFENLS
jgi:hypothetical protein